jgi:DNA-binding MarR family transcriptional regulator
MNTIEPPLDGKQRERLRPLSKLLFRSEYALEAFALIAQKDRFYNGELAETTGCQPNFASQLIKRLEQGGLIEPIEREEGQSRHYFEKTESALWPLFLEIVRVTLSEPEAEVTQLRPHG